jgi:hypothetical protein
MVTDGTGVAAFAWQDKGRVYGLSSGFPLYSDQQQGTVMRNVKTKQDDGTYKIPVNCPPMIHW